ncbi:nuclear transport factor 2 family protein [Sphingobium phenoxybenzoativorans]|uniref:nuclear transport factor 2 family protein n=1 Tax=Sphingobium phenoxybenzoativorans TaxID=1592790 RepID=UPI000871E33B|nr:nuclear transport factor 2 family protein [Sphingobium phenoxybenzoativorans]
MDHSKYEKVESLRPFFDLIEEAIGDLVDGDHFFDYFAKDGVLEAKYAMSGVFRTEGRDKILASFQRYGDILWLDSMSDLKVHYGRDPNEVILEYTSHGKGVKTGNPYNNCYASFIRLENRKIKYWLDYIDQVEVMRATGTTDRIKERGALQSSQ